MNNAELQELVDCQSDLLQRWVVFGTEIRRRYGPLPIDLALELSELVRESNDCR
jgi:hypothetical protein